MQAAVAEWVGMQANVCLTEMCCVVVLLISRRSRRRPPLIAHRCTPVDDL